MLSQKIDLTARVASPPNGGLEEGQICVVLLSPPYPGILRQKRGGARWRMPWLRDQLGQALWGYRETGLFETAEIMHRGEARCSERPARAGRRRKPPPAALKRNGSCRPGHGGGCFTQNTKGQAMLSKCVTAAALAAAMWTAPAMAATITHQTFDTDPTIGPGQASGVWYTDRYAPAAFDSQFFDGDDRLRIGLSEDDGAIDRGESGKTFRNTQGRKYDTPGAISVSIDLYISDQWGPTDRQNRVAGLWGTAVNASGDIVWYPIIEFFTNEFQVWDALSATTPTDPYTPIGLPGSFQLNDWATLAIEVDRNSDQFHYSVNDELLYSTTANGAHSMKNIILQAYNTEEGINRDVYFDNLHVSAVPVPAALPLFGTALAGLAFMRRRNAAAR